MTSFDQLGLFNTNKGEPFDKVVNPCSKFSLTVEFSNSSDFRVDELIKKITKDIEKIDNRASVIAKTNLDEQPWVEQGFFAIDVETTGLDAASNRVIELAIVPFNMSEQIKPFCKLFSVGESLSQEIIDITGISDDMLKNQPSFADSAEECLRMLRSASFVVAYNAKFDRPFLESEMARLNKVLPDIPWIDPFVFICELDRFKRGKKLSDAARRWGVNLENAHRAMADAQAAGKLMLKIADKIGCRTVDDLIAKQKIWQWQNAHNMAELKRGNNWSVNR